MTRACSRCGAIEVVMSEEREGSWSASFYRCPVCWPGAVGRQHGWDGWLAGCLDVLNPDSKWRALVRSRPPHLGA